MEINLIVKNLVTRNLVYVITIIYIFYYFVSHMSTTLLIL